VQVDAAAAAAVPGAHPVPPRSRARHATAGLGSGRRTVDAARAAWSSRSGEQSRNKAVADEDGGRGRVVPIGSNSLGSLGEREVLHAYCRRCKRAERLDRSALLDRHGDLHLRALRRRLRCTACGARDAEVIRATALPR
jgi:hypothetical protein